MVHKITTFIKMKNKLEKLRQVANKKNEQSVLVESSSTTSTHNCFNTP